MNQTAGDGFAKSTATPITTGGISDAKTRSGSSGTQSFALVSNQNKQKSSSKEKSNENEDCAKIWAQYLNRQNQQQSNMQCQLVPIPCEQQRVVAILI